MVAPFSLTGSITATGTATPDLEICLFISTIVVTAFSSNSSCLKALAYRGLNEFVSYPSSARFSFELYSMIKPSSSKP